MISSAVDGPLIQLDQGDAQPCVSIFFIAAGLHQIARGVCHNTSINTVYDLARHKKAGFLFLGGERACFINSLLGPLSVWF